MLRDTPCKPEQTIWVDGVWVEFSLAHTGEIQASKYFFPQCLGFTGTAERLVWLLLGFWGLLYPRKRLR